MPSRVIRARLDEPSEAALATLMREGRNESEAIRAALVEAHERRLRRSALRAETARLAADPADAAERAAVRAAFDQLTPDWPA
jgi:Arc/MetJ-type ribon-helix-helix transcriptional regulator